MKKKNIFLSSYKRLNVLITGTTGFKGAWLAFWLNNLGANITGVSLKPEKNSILFKSLKLQNKINQYYFDIANFKKIDNVIKKNKPDIIFHLAAQSLFLSFPVKVIILLNFFSLAFFAPFTIFGEFPPADIKIKLSPSSP